MTITKLIQQIRAFMDQGRGRDMEQGKKLARQHAEACTKASERLGQCATYLSKSMVSEALQVAESNPPLLDLIGQLDFMSVEDWRHLCEDEGWPVAPPFDENQIAQLNEAYASASSVEPMLKEFRRAVREKRTLDCVRILRGLIDLQPDNTSWKADLVEFEKRRIHEIRASVASLKQISDEESLSHLAVELSQPWTIGNVQPIRDEVQQALNALRVIREADSGRTLLQEIAAAYSALNVDRIGPLIGRYQKLCQSPFYKPKPDAMSQFSEAEEWYKAEMRARLEKKEFEASVGRLQDGVERRDVNKIEEAFVDLARSSMSPPERLEQLGRSILADAKVARERRHKRIVLVCLSILVSITIAVALFYLQQHRQQVIDQASAELNELFDELNVRGFDMRLRRIEEDSPWLYRSDEIQSWARRQSELERIRTEREAAFTRLIRQLESYEHDRFDRAPDDIDHMLVQARDLALTGDDFHRIASVQEAWTDEAERRQTTRDDKSIDVLAAVEERVDRIEEQMSRIATESAVAYLAARSEEVSEAMSTPGLSEFVRTRGHRLEDRITHLQTQLVSRERQRNALENSRTLQAYLDTMNVYVTAFPEDGLAKRIADINNRAPHYRDFIKAGERPLGGSSLWHEVNERVSAWRRAQLENWPMVQRRLMELGDDRMLTELFVADSTRGNTYFLGRPIRDTEDRGGVRYRVFGGNAYRPTRSEMQPDFSFQVIPESQAHNMRLMPHCDAVANMLSSFRFGTPATAFDLMLTQIQSVYDNQDMSPLLRLRLVVTLVEQLKLLEGNQGLLLWDGLLNEASRIPDDIHWLSGLHRDVIRANREADAILTRYLKSERAIQQSRFNRIFHERLYSARIGWAGRVAFDSRTNIIWNTSQPVAELLVVRVSDQGQAEVHIARETDEERERRYVVLEPGEPVFYFRGEDSAREILMQSIREARIGTSDLASFDWPRVWLVNLRP